MAERTSDLKLIAFTSVDALKGRDRALASFDANPTVNYAWDLSFRQLHFGARELQSFGIERTREHTGSPGVERWPAA